MQTLTASAGRMVVVFILTMISTSGRSISVLDLLHPFLMRLGMALRTALNGNSWGLPAPDRRPYPASEAGGGPPRRACRFGLLDLPDGLPQFIHREAAAAQDPQPSRLRDRHHQFHRRAGASPDQGGPMPALKIGYSIPNRSHNLVRSTRLPITPPKINFWILIPLIWSLDNFNLERGRDRFSILSFGQCLRFQGPISRNSPKNQKGL